MTFICDLGPGSILKPYKIIEENKGMGAEAE